MQLQLTTERIQKRLEVLDKEFEKFKFSVVVMTRMKTLPDTPDLTLNLEDFRPPLNQRELIQPLALIHDIHFQSIDRSIYDRNVLMMKLMISNLHRISY